MDLMRQAGNIRNWPRWLWAAPCDRTDLHLVQLQLLEHIGRWDKEHTAENFAKERCFIEEKILQDARTLLRGGLIRRKGNDEFRITQKGREELHKVWMGTTMAPPM